MYNTILVGFDGSEPAERALVAACALAKRFDAKLEVSHTPLDETVTFAAEAISGFYVGATVAQDELLRDAAAEIADRARVIASAAGMPVIDVNIGQGDPVENVIARAQDLKADLIVTGRRGLGGVAGLLMGSTSQGISKKATCAVMTVP